MSSHNQPGPAPLPDETVLQFGTGRFLRAFTGLFLEEVNRASATGSEEGNAPQRIVVVQSTGGERAAQFQRQQGRYHVAVRGLRDGARVDRVEPVESVSRALAAGTAWHDVLALARAERLRLIVSNVTEAGYRCDPSDRIDDRPPRAFPAKLLILLKARWEYGLGGPAILPCELLEQNADRLRTLLVGLARQWRLEPALVEYVADGCAWHNTLVDRIVSAPSPGDPLAQADPLLAVAEPFALWAIQGQAEPHPLARHPAIEWTTDLAACFLRKVRILNGAHTALVARALPRGYITVREAIAEPDIGEWLEELLFEEIVPVLHGRTESPGRFARQVLERFENPFLEHRLADIALHHAAKLQTRLAPTAEEYRQRFGHPPRRLTEALDAAIPAT